MVQQSGAQQSGIIARREGSLGRITLDRPKAMNALSLAMIRAMREALEEWRGDDRVLAVAVDGAGERGLCAGGDIRALHAQIKAGERTPITFWREEYALNATIGAYPKPYVVLMDGVVMGGGVGISAHGSHRLVTPRSMIAMPEVALGFFPDVGGTWLLARAPGLTGRYLGLTGARMGAADAIAGGFADATIEGAAWPAIVEKLSRSRDPALIDQVISSGRIDPGPSALLAQSDAVGRLFVEDRLEVILASLRAAPAPFSTAALRSIEAACPMALKVTLAAIRHAGRLGSLDACLAMEMRLAEAMAYRGDFAEGIRAAVIDKDQRPRWSPARLEDIDDREVERIVKGDGEGRT